MLIALLSANAVSGQPLLLFFSLDVCGEIPGQTRAEGNTTVSG